MALDFTKPVQTRSGYKVRVYVTDGDGEYPVVGHIDGAARPSWWRIGGEHPSDKSLDLINVPKRIQRTYWANVYPGNCHFYDSPAAAKRDQITGCLGVAEVHIDIPEGEGL